MLQSLRAPKPVITFVPPLLKYLAGPLLGPAQLAGVGLAVGVPVRVVDINAHWLARFSTAAAAANGVLGDHARPVGGFARAQSAWERLCRSALGAAPGAAVSLLPFTHVDVFAAAHRLACVPDFRELVMPHLVGPRPRFVGVSVLWSGQVLAGLALSVLARQRWPGVPVIWGGAHVTALADEIGRDPAYGALVDGFVAGYAEETFRRMLVGDPLSALGVFRAGSGAPPRAMDSGDVRPRFQRLGQYGVPRLTLPVQVSRGCAYGRCAFCTYPAIEGAYRTTSMAPLESVVRYAMRRGADVAIKDAFVTKRRLLEIGEVVAGRVRWAACTRLVPRLERDVLQTLVRKGLGTLEIGVESVDPEVLRKMDKRQSVEALEHLLQDAAGLDLHLVLNVMFGFPGQTLEEAREQYAALTRQLPARFPNTRFTFEVNYLEVERRSPLARDPDRYGVRLGQTWPWSSLVEWDAPSWRGALDLLIGTEEVA